MVMLIPTKELVYAPLLETRQDQLTPSYKKLIAEEREVFRRLKSSLQENGIPHVSMLPVLQHSLLLHQAPYPHSMDGHPSATGHRAMAQCMAHFIRNNFPHGSAG